MIYVISIDFVNIFVFINKALQGRFIIAMGEAHRKQGHKQKSPARAKYIIDGWSPSNHYVLLNTNDYGTINC